jgi:hypothetical protein
MGELYRGKNLTYRAKCLFSEMPVTTLNEKSTVIFCEKFKPDQVTAIKFLLNLAAVFLSAIGTYFVITEQAPDRAKVPISNFWEISKQVS